VPTAPVIAAAKDLFAAVSEHGAGEAFGRDGWLDVLSDTQEAINALAAVQALAMAHSAAFDSDDGHGWGPATHRGLGHRALDAPDLVAARLGCSSQAATGRVDTAIEQVTTMPTLVQAMADGDLDSYRAAVVSDELRDAGADARAAVVDRLAASGHLTGDTAGPLRRRARKLLGSLAPEVLEARVREARTRRGLHRSTEPDGLDHWEAWLPVESARPAWTIVTQLAQDHLRAGRAETLAQARADALCELLVGDARGSYAFHVTVPFAAFGAEANAAPPGPTASSPEDHDDELVAVTGFGTPGETLVSRRWLRELTGAPAPRGARGTTRTPRGSRRTRRVETIAVNDASGAVAGRLVPGADEDRASIVAPEVAGYRPSAELDRLVRARDGGCRFPGCSIGVRFVDLDHVVAYDHDDRACGGPTALANLACLCRRHHRIKQRAGWAAVLHPDGSMTWTDPSGRVRTTWPQDHRPPDRPATSDARRDPAGPERGEDRPPGSPPHPVDPAELEPFSVLEDDLLVRLRDLSGVDGSHLASVHNDAPRRHGRCRHDDEPRPAVEIRHRPTIRGRPVVLAPAWLADLHAARQAASAPPF
jgi:hypothetical protein